MKQCLKIVVRGKVHGVGYREFVQKNARKLELEGTVQNQQDGSVLLYVCGNSENLDKLIDELYLGVKGSVIEDILVEPLSPDRDFRGVFRTIGVD